MIIGLLGTSHKVAPIEIREKFSFKEEEIKEFLLKLLEEDFILEAFLLSTCNRTEIYFVAAFEEFEKIKKYLKDYKKLNFDLEKYIYTHKNLEAIFHGFKVASSLDSLVVGEPQIVNQFKNAYFLAKEIGSIGQILDRFCQNALKVSKKVRSLTDIAKGEVSIASVAVDLAKKIFGKLEDKKVALIGAGEMAQNAIKHLIKEGVKEIFIVNRSLEKAHQIAQSLKQEFEDLKVEIYPLNKLSEALEKADVVISSTSAPSFIITYEDIKKIIDKKKGYLFLIDIALPRDIDPKVQEFENVFVFYIDDLEKIVQENLKQRQLEALKAEEIVKEEAIRFYKWLKEYQVYPIIATLKERAEKIRKEELEKKLKKLNLDEKTIKEIDYITKVIVNKILHTQITNAKLLAKEDEDGKVIKILKNLFDIS